MKNHYQILVIGAGTGGIMTAAHLKKRNSKLDIGIIDPAENHWYQPAWTLVGAGTFNYEKTRRSMKSVIPHGVDWIQDSVSKLSPESNSIETAASGHITYDYLVVSPGIQMNLDDIEGLRDALNTDFVCSNYTDPKKTWDVLQQFKGGNAVFTQPATPIKCGGAPQKIMYLADDYFRRMDVRKKSNVVFATPGSVIFGVDDFKKTLEKILVRKDIKFKAYYSPYKIDGKEKKIYFKYAKPDSQIAQTDLDSSLNEYISESGDVIMPYDMLHLAPPQGAPDFVKYSPLSNNAGWVDVNKFTLQHNKYPNVFSLGDVADLPTAKTGAAIRKQAPVVAENLLTMIKSGSPGVSKYEGYSSCPLVTGYGKMVLAEFKYDNVRDSDPLLSKFLDTSKESWLLWILKKYGLPFLYWNYMLKGKM